MEKDHLKLVNALTDDNVKNADTKLRKYLIFLIFICLLVGVSGYVYTNLFSDIQVATSRAIQVQGNTYSANLNAVGYVVAKREANISSKVVGVITQLPIEEGDFVKNQQIIAQLDDSVIKKELMLAKSNLIKAQDNIREIEVRINEAQLELDRTREMVTKEFFSQALLDKASAEVSALQARAISAKSSVAVAKSNYELKKAQVEQYQIRAPFSGIVTSKHTNLGETVFPGSTGEYTTTGICTIIDMDSREIEVDVNEAYIKRVFKGQSVEVKLDAYPEWVVKAKVINYAPIADRQKATVKVRIKLDKLDDKVLPDMGVRVKFFSDKYVGDTVLEPKIFIPVSALNKDETGDFVWIVKKGLLQKINVKAGESLKNKIEVLSGVNVGDEVVIESKSNLAINKKAKIINE